MLQNKPSGPGPLSHRYDPRQLPPSWARPSVHLLSIHTWDSLMEITTRELGGQACREIALEAITSTIMGNTIGKAAELLCMMDETARRMGVGPEILRSRVGAEVGRNRMAQLSDREREAYWAFGEAGVHALGELCLVVLPRERVQGSPGPDRTIEVLAYGGFRVGFHTGLLEGVCTSLGLDARAVLTHPDVDGDGTCAFRLEY